MKNIYILVNIFLACVTSVAATEISAYYSVSDLSKGYYSDDINYQQLDKLIYKGIKISDCKLNSRSVRSSDFIKPLCLSELPIEENNAIVSGLVDLIKHGKPVLLNINDMHTNDLVTIIQPQFRDVFIDSIEQFFEDVRLKTISSKRRYGTTFAGVNIDWQPYANTWFFLYQKGARNELQNYLDFLSLIKFKLLAEVDITLPAKASIIKKVEDVYPGFWRKLSSIVDVMNINTYYHNTLDIEQFTNYNSPLYFDKNQPQEVDNRENGNIFSTVGAYLKYNIDPSRLVITIPTFGVGYSEVSQKNDGLYQKFSNDDFSDSLVKEINYRDIVTLSASDWKIVKSEMKIGQALAYNKKQSEFLTIDTPETVKEKIMFVKKYGLKGVLFSDIAGDLKKNDAFYDKKSLLVAADEANLDN